MTRVPAMQAWPWPYDGRTGSLDSKGRTVEKGKGRTRSARLKVRTTPEIAPTPSLPAAMERPTRRRLSFVGLGSSTSGRTASEADEMLAEGFGRV